MLFRGILLANDNRSLAELYRITVCAPQLLQFAHIDDAFPAHCIVWKGCGQSRWPWLISLAFSPGHSEPSVLIWRSKSRFIKFFLSPSVRRGPLAISICGLNTGGMG